MVPRTWLKRARIPDLRAQVSAMCAELELKPPFEAESLAAKIAKARDYVIEIEPHPMIGQAVSGSVHPFHGGIFIIYYNRDVPRLLRELIIYHELAHIWLQHVTPESKRVPCGDTFITLTTPHQDAEAEEWARYVAAYAQILIGRDLAERLDRTGAQRFSRYGKMLSHFEV